MAKKQKESPTKKTSPPRPGEPVYTMMAFVTLVAIALGCILLYMDFEDYGKQAAPTEKPPALPKLGEEQKAGPGTPPAPQPGN